MAIAPNATKTTVIDGDDFAAALDDPKVAALIDGALAYGDALRASGRDHSLGSSD